MKNSLRIPRIIHQTWKTKDVPSPLDQLPQTWKEYLPNWEYILWTDEMNREFVCKHFPDFLEKYDTYPCNIQRADAIRYLLLKVYGGLYVDMDFECLENIEFLLEGSDFIVGRNPTGMLNALVLNISFATLSWRQHPIMILSTLYAKG